MIKPFKKLSLILLAAILCLAPIVMAACGDNSSAPADTDAADTTLASEETVTENPADPKLPEKDYVDKLHHSYKVFPLITNGAKCRAGPNRRTVKFERRNLRTQP